MLIHPSKLPLFQSGWKPRFSIFPIYPGAKPRGILLIKEQTAYFDGLTFEKITDTELNVYVVIGEKDEEKQEVKFAYKLVE